jgi:hypothetical protein
MPYFGQVIECFLCELIPVIVVFRNVVLCDVVERSAYVHDVRSFRIA